MLRPSGNECVMRLVGPVYTDPFSTTLPSIDVFLTLHVKAVTLRTMGFWRCRSDRFHIGLTRNDYIGLTSLTVNGGFVWTPVRSV